MAGGNNKVIYRQVIAGHMLQNDSKEILIYCFRDINPSFEADYE
ncbi:hypothetical protein [Atlantibacter hermannii]